jgi:hypothetical protein
MFKNCLVAPLLVAHSATIARSTAAATTTTPMHLESEQTKLAVISSSLEKMDDAGVRVNKYEHFNKKPEKDRMPNFRNVLGFAHLYRSSSPDDVADVLEPASPQQEDMINGNSDRELSPSFNSQHEEMRPSLTESERFLLHDATLWIDMRFSKEINEHKLATLLKHAPGGAFESVVFDDSPGLEKAIGHQRAYLGSPEVLAKTTDDHRHRFYLHNSKDDPFFSEESFMKYVCAHWVPRDDLEKAVDRDAKIQLIGKAVQQRVSLV